MEVDRKTPPKIGSSENIPLEENGTVNIDSPEYKSVPTIDIDRTPLMNKKTFFFLRTFSLVTLTIQNSLLALSLRYGTTRPGDRFFPTTAVLLTEVCKFFLCLFLVYLEKGNFRNWINALHSSIIQQPLDTLKVSVVAILYVMQNNLLYVSASHLDATTNQVTYQLKILTTAVFAVIMLKKRLSFQQWLALVFLIFGIVLVQLTNSTDSAGKNNAEQSKIVGICAALSACILSGFAGVYFEVILKMTNVSIWIRNVQLSVLSIPVALTMCGLKDLDKILEKGFFFGYDSFVIYLIFLQAGGGLIVAVVVKYADNILKGFATSMAIVISAVISVYFFAFSISIQFVVGATLVVFSIFMYNVKPNKPKPVKPNDLKEIDKDQKV